MILRHHPFAAAAALLPLLAGCASVGPAESFGAAPAAAPSDEDAGSMNGASPAPSGVLSAGVPSAQAAPRSDLAAAAPADEWKFVMAPYVWLLDIDGKIGTGAGKVPISAHLQDAVDLVQEHFDFAFAGHFEARKGDWALFFDGNHLAFSEESSASKPILGELGIASADLDVDLEITFIELGAARRVAYIPVGGRAAPVEILGGVRWNSMNLDVDLEAAATAARRNFERAFDVDFENDWADPFVGLRTLVPVTDKASLYLRADIGGGVGSGSDIVRNVVTGLLVRLGESTEFFGGWRWYDFERDSGGHDSDLQIEGPGIGLEMRF